VGVEDGKVTTLADPGWDFAAHCAWLPDGRSLLVVARGRDQANSQLWAVSHPEGEVRRVTNDLNDRRLVSLTADGRVLVSVAGTLSSSIWSVPLRGTGRARRMSRATTDGIAGVALAADGRLVYTSETGNATGVSSFTPR
jgi:Tol biopolymer transport system component